MSREQFVKGYLERLIEKDPHIRGHFDRAETDRERDLLREGLRRSLEGSYDTYAREYFDSKGLGSYLSTFLRWTGAAADIAGTYVFWALGPAGVHITAPAAAGFKGLGFAEKGLADLIDGYHYAKHAETDSITEKATDGAKIATEGALERIAAFTPFTFGGAEAFDLFRGKRKYDKKVTARALYKAKQDFLDYARRDEEKQPQTISLEKFRHPAYAEAA